MSDQQLERPTTVQTKDGFTFTVYTNDVIQLTEQQFQEVAANVMKRKAAYIVKNGVDIVALTTEQVQSVLEEIHSRIGVSKNPLQDDLIRISEHIVSDHGTNPDELKRRGWYRDRVEDIYEDIVSVIRAAENVRKAKLKFRKLHSDTAEKFTFTILGVKVDGEEGSVSIAFIEDRKRRILVVTIL